MRNMSRRPSDGAKPMTEGTIKGEGTPTSWYNHAKGRVKGRAQDI